MLKGVAIAFATYAVFSGSDAAMKAAGSNLHVAQITLMVTFFASIVVFFAKPRSERWLDMFRIRHPVPVAIRVVTSIGAGLTAAYAFTHLPLADAYSLLFLLPLFVAAFSYFYLRERVSPARLLGLALGLAGVLLVVRPGFREILPGHFAAIGTAVFGAVTLLMLRLVGRTERQVTLIGTYMVGSLVVNGIMTAFVFKWPSWTEVLLLAICGFLAGFGHLGLMAAARHAPANRVGPVQYSQIIWAVVLGALFFDEMPDAIALVGILFVCLSGVLNFLNAGDEPVVPATGEAVSAETAVRPRR